MTEQWQELKETIIEMRDNDGTGTQQETCKFLVDYMETLEKQMQEPKWIPVSERLPEHNMSVLITVRRYDDEIVVRSGYYYAHGDNSIFHADNGNCWGIDEDGLLAWMPLPEPYKEEEE